MKLELYALPNCMHAEAIRVVLNKNSLPFKEILVNDEKTKLELEKLSHQNKVSVLKITKSHSITIIDFNEHMLNQLIEHIKKYNSKLEK